MDFPKKKLVIKKAVVESDSIEVTDTALPTTGPEGSDLVGVMKPVPKIKPKPVSDDVLTDVSDTATNLTEVDDIYQDLELREHIYLLPDTYIGGVDPEIKDMWLLEEVSNRMNLEKVEYVPGVFKIYDEVLVNAIDQHVRVGEKIKYRDLLKAGKMPPTQDVPNGDIPYRPVKSIRISVCPIDNRISIENDGDGIDIDIHKRLGIYVPEMIFSRLLTGTNYKADVKRIVGGRNGYGAKLTNIFSKEFTIETVDAMRKRRYKQTFRNNMTVIEPPEIEENYKKVPFTKITYVPDLARFKLSSLDNTIVRIMKKRAYDAAAFVDGASVYWNDVKVEIKSFERYVDMYIGSKSETKRHYAQPDERWEVAACSSRDHNFMQVSMVNGMCTTRGGKHVEYITNQITKKLCEHLNSKKKGTDLKPQHIKNNLFLFLKCTLENPKFDTQSKECVTSLVSEFGSKCTIDDDFITKLAKTDIGDKAIALSNFKEGEKHKEAGANKRHKIIHEKLEEGSYCGGAKSGQCTLILTEGDSARTFAMSGLKALGEENRKYYGVFPLRGKLLNVRDATPKQIRENEEVIALQNIIGLQVGKDYLGNNQNLRYGSVLIITDQDEDGSHIKGLLFNFFHFFWPSLLQRNTSIKAMNTPLVRIWKEKKKGQSMVRDQSTVQTFYAERDYETWRKTHKGEKGWKYKYYKGLGTNTPTEAEECFKNLKIVNYLWDTSNVSELDLDLGPAHPVTGNFPGGKSASVEFTGGPTDSIEPSDTEASDLESEDPSNASVGEPEEGGAGAGTLFVIKTKKGPKAKGMVINGMNRTDYSINLAFKKGFEDSRKDWIQGFDHSLSYDFNAQEETYSDFINKRLVSFSYEDCVRSIPSVCDGLKPGQRKIIYSVQKKKQKTDIKVAQLAGYVSEHTDYHHGEVSLHSTIIGLAQDYVSSNNINLIVPSGMFGTRMGGSPGGTKEGLGKDHASARYIYTRQSNVMPHLFNVLDNPLYEYNRTDAGYIEPKHYVPILPMILINGSAGIGTGYSTNLPCYNPLHLIENIKQIMDGNPPVKMIPWYRGFRGDINIKTTKSYTSHGVYRAINSNQLEVTELPISNCVSFMQYKAFIISILTNKINLNKEGKEKKTRHALTGKIIDVDFDITDQTFKAIITFAPGELQTMFANQAKLEKDLKLVTTINCTNMYLFNSKGYLQKYDTVEEILQEYYTIRLDTYGKRRAYLLEDLTLDFNKLSAKAQFIRDIHETKIVINETVGTKTKPKRKAEIEEQLTTLKYPKFGKKRRANPGTETKVVKETEEVEEIEAEVEGEEEIPDANNPVKEDENDTYDYLLSMRIDSLTEEMLKKLEEDRDEVCERLTTLQNKTAQGLWLDDLDALKEVYLESLAIWHEENKIAQSDIQNKLVKKAVSFKKNPLPPPKKVTITRKPVVQKATGPLKQTVL